MTATFFATKNDQNIDLDAYEIRLSNVNAARVQRALGVHLDDGDQPAGELPLDDFLSALAHGYHAAGDQSDMRLYLNTLNSLWGAAVDAGADTICWG